MDAVQAAVVGLLIVAYSLLGRRFDHWRITAPMVFCAAGALSFWLGGGLSAANETVHLLAELALVVVLFHDASTVKLRALRADLGLPARLLAIGFPLALLATLACTALLLPALGFAGALLVAASITPTDAGLGAPTILNPSVPLRIRRALNVESGLNDGLATPVVLVALGMLSAQEHSELPKFLSVGLIPLTIGLAIGIGLGLLAGFATDVSAAHALSSARGRAVGALVLPFVALGLAEMLSGNGFIAAFVGGLTYGAASRRYGQEPEASELLEVGSDLLSYIVWFLAGGLFLGVYLAGIRWQWVVLAVAALTVLRVLPVAICLLGTGLRWPTDLFVGWFGPRGLATIVFGLLTVEELGAEAGIVADAIGVVTVTVTLSVLAHGISAGPLSERYGRWVQAGNAPAEASKADELPTPLVA